ncbi:pentapeptide repeat-containing protein [Streptomyces sp. NPDC088810]|uniref:pentapeptide repeat-containing protein n=1 Tax=Streptomyces sp. NPDC088810 TaxID=3365904 RepID=UPI003817260A
MEEKSVEEVLRGLLYLACPDAPDDARSDAVDLLSSTHHQLSDELAAHLTAKLTPRAAKGAPLDLRRADLHGADLREADLHRANLAFADLRGSDLRDADLHRANLAFADLRGSDLRDADLRHAQLVLRVQNGAVVGSAAGLAAALWLLPVSAIVGGTLALDAVVTLRQVLKLFMGAQWSTGTRWPTAWKPIVRRASIATSPTTFEVVGWGQGNRTRDRTSV